MTEVAATTKQLRRIQARVSNLPEAIEKMIATIEQLDAQMRELKDAGLIYGKIHLRGKKYALVVYPMQNGKRPNPTYIGTDKAKVDEAEAAIKRAVEYEALKRTASSLSAHIWQTCQMFDSLERALQ